MAREVPDFDVFPSAEGALAHASEHGYAGCISATANVTAPFAQAAWSRAGSPEGRESLEKAVALREALSSLNLVASIKWALSQLHDDTQWARVMPPLRPLGGSDVSKLQATLQPTAFSELAKAA
jgi:4-hydroxy-tetrahydrodipicolinate synthase